MSPIRLFNFGGQSQTPKLLSTDTPGCSLLLSFGEMARFWGKTRISKFSNTHKKAIDQLGVGISSSKSMDGSFAMFNTTRLENAPFVLFNNCCNKNTE